MKTKATSKSAFFNLRGLIALVLCLFGVFVALVGSGAFAQTKGTRASRQPARSNTRQDAPGTQRPDVVQMVGPVIMNQDLRSIPYVPTRKEHEQRRLTRHVPFNTGHTTAPSGYRTSGLKYVQTLLKNLWRPIPTMPGPLLTFEGIGDLCGCQPSDSEGDVGPNHYVEAINESFKIFDKNGNTLAGPIGYDTFFAPLTGTPCGSNQNDGDPFVMYDLQADRWVITDFAFPSFPGSSFWECIAVSQSPDPVAGPWAFYAIQVDPANPTFLGDYPKLAIWNDGGTQNAYFLMMNLFASFTEFDGVRAYALDRASMLAGGPANAIGFTLGLAGVGDSYSFVAANFRTGNPPPAGRDEMVLAVDATIPGAVLTQVHARFFHVDFANPGNATFGVGADHTPNAEITVNPFVQAWTAQTYDLVPQQGTSVTLDTVGDKIMTPVVYQNRSGTESLWADQTTMLNFPNGPTVVTWYQFDVTGGNFPATPVQQQDWSNGNDGLWRWMPSIAVDQSGNTVIGYATSNTTIVPSIRYAGRLTSDPPGDLAQGEGIMWPGVGPQTSGSRWGDYTRTEVDPSNGMDFWHINQYAQNGDWHTRIGKFNFQGGGVTPTPTPSATPASCSWAAGPSLPSVGTRMVGVFFPANGKFYAMGGRSSDIGGSEFTHPFEYDPGSNSWTIKSATYPDNQVNNMACAVMNQGGTDYIYCVGGSEVATQTATGRVFRYDPITDTISTVPANWPSGDQNFVPGGFSVYNNNMYILGGFEINVAMDDNIWQFDPVALLWTHKNAHLPTQLGYIPQATIGNLIYTGGGSTYDGTLLHDSNISLVYDPVADTIGNIATIPRATAETRGLNFCNTMYVMGGGREAPNPSNEVDIYDPVANSWSVGTPFVEARRNFPTATNGIDHIWLAGGYASDGVTVLDSMEIFSCPVSPCGPTPTPTATATPTATPTPTATAAPRATPTPRPRPTPAPR